MNRFMSWVWVGMACTCASAACSEDGDGSSGGSGGSLPMGGLGGAAGMVTATGGTTGAGGTATGVVLTGSGGMDGSGGLGGAGTGGATPGAGGMTAGASAMGGAAGDASGSGGADGGASFALTSSAVEEGGMLPAEHRCVSLGGDSGPSPPLSWSGAPAATMSFAVTLTDVTPGAANGFAHWTIYDIPIGTTSLPEDVPLGATLAMPAGAKQSPNQASFLPGPGYFGPCGGENTYEFEVHALDVAALPDVNASSSAQEVRGAIAMHQLESATLTVLSSPP